MMIGLTIVWVGWGFCCCDEAIPSVIFEHSSVGMGTLSTALSTLML